VAISGDILEEVRNWVFLDTWDTVEIVYNPGHAGVSCNETADKLVGDAVAFGNLDMTASDVIASVTAAFLER
jgi:hypothetical protein